MMNHRPSVVVGMLMSALERISPALASYDCVVVLSHKSEDYSVIAYYNAPKSIGLYERAIDALQTSIDRGITPPPPDTRVMMCAHCGKVAELALTANIRPHHGIIVRCPLCGKHTGASSNSKVDIPTPSPSEG